MTLRTLLHPLCIAFACLTWTGGSSAAETIGFVTQSTSNAGWTLINQGVESAVEAINEEREAAAAAAASVEADPDASPEIIELKLRTVLQSFNGSESQQTARLQTFINDGVDALIFAPQSVTGALDALLDAEAAGIPVILIDSASPDLPFRLSVGTDAKAMAIAQGRLACENIVNGQAVAYLTAGDKNPLGALRFDGFVQGFGQAGCQNSEIIALPSDWNGRVAQENAAAVIAYRPDVKLMAGAWDGATLAIVAAMRNSGMAPGDLGVIGIDGTPEVSKLMEAGWVQANVGQRLSHIGRSALGFALQAIEGDELPKKVAIEPFIITSKTLDDFLALN